MSFQGISQFERYSLFTAINAGAVAVFAAAYSHPTDSLPYIVPRHADDQGCRDFPVSPHFHLWTPSRFIFHPLYLTWCPDTLTEDLFRSKFKNSTTTLLHSFHFSTSSTYHLSQSKRSNLHSRSKTDTHEMFSHHHNVLTIPGGADLPIEFHSQLAKKWWKNGNLAGPKELNTFVNPVENTVPEWVKRRDAEINDSDKGETSTQPPSEEVSTYKCAFSTLRESEDFNAFFSTAVPHARSEESFLRLRTIFLINTSGSTLQLSQKIQADRQVLRRASELLILAL